AIRAVRYREDGIRVILEGARNFQGDEAPDCHGLVETGGWEVGGGGVPRDAADRVGGGPEDSPAGARGTALQADPPPRDRERRPRGGSGEARRSPRATYRPATTRHKGPGQLDPAGRVSPRRSPGRAA